MGVTLERVQHKFACIIGELCGEPKILSQFAVWIDLRLAEYKSKGSISLECSGSVPEPSWLEGLVIPLSNISANHLTPYGDPSQTFSRTQRLNSFGARSPPNQNALGTVIKAEPLFIDDGSPVHSLSSRKRSFDAGVPFGLQQFDGSSMTKLSKSSHTPQHTVSSPRQSRVPSVTSPIQSEVFQESPSNTSDIDFAQSIINNIKNDSSPNSVYPNSRGPSTENKETSDRLFTSTFESERCGTNFKMAAGVLLSGIPGGARSRTSSDLLTFQNWLRTKPDITPRPIQDIPPQELDILLADFFRTVKNRRGKDYDHKSLKYIRASLERHLKANSYPVSITRSAEFHNSQQAYHLRKKQLHLSSLLNVNSIEDDSSIS